MATDAAMGDLNNSATVRNVEVDGSKDMTSLSNLVNSVPDSHKRNPAMGAQETAEVIKRNEQLERSINLLQNFMVKKGLMTEEELSECTEINGRNGLTDKQRRLPPTANTDAKKKRKGGAAEPGKTRPTELIKH